MAELFKIAFRNIFRNWRRSLITAFISFLGVMIVIAGSSFLGGMLGNIVDENIKMTGHARLTSKDYEQRERMLSLAGNVTGYAELKKKIAACPGVKTVAGRIKFGCVMYKDEENKQCLGYGIEREDFSNLNLDKFIYQGRVLEAGARDEAIIGRQLAESLHLKIGDEVTLLTRTLYNSTWALNFKVVGIFDMQNGKLNKLFYISLPAAQELLDMNDTVLEVLAFGSSREDTANIVKNIRAKGEIRVLALKRWNEIGLAPVLSGIVTVVSTIIQMILVILGGLGIANTMMMAVFERKNEIGILKSMGMHDPEIIWLFTLEGFMMGCIGTLCGLAIGGAGAYYLNTYGINLGSKLQGLPIAISNIIYGVFNVQIFVKGLVMGLVVAVLASLLPALGGVRLNPTEALRKD